MRQSSFAKNVLTAVVLAVVIVAFYNFAVKYMLENKILKEVIERLQADSRVAEVLVSDVLFDEKTNKTYTTIKFLEYDVNGQPGKPKYLTFTGNIIQFQSLVIRFDDIYIRQADKLKGKSAYLFWKVFMLDGKNTQEYEISKINAIPQGYKLPNSEESFEVSLWARVWAYALDQKQAKSVGVKNAQIEAPGAMFVPGYLYTIKIEHDGGLRIDSTALSPILKGEKLP